MHTLEKNPGQITFHGPAYSNSELLLHTERSSSLPGLLGSFITVSDHYRLLDAPWGRTAKPLVSPLTTIALTMDNGLMKQKFCRFL